MHRSNKQRRMNKTFTVFTNEHCTPSPVAEDKQPDSTRPKTSPLSEVPSADDRFRTFTKRKIHEHPGTVIVNPYQHRYFDSPTMITMDDEDDDDIPVLRCSNKRPVVADAEPSLDESDLTDLLVFTNPNRALSESMQVVISRHPSLEDLKYINDLSSVLVIPPLLLDDQEEHIYQELIRVNHSITTPPADHANDVDENKENRPPLMPIKGPVSRIPVWTPPETSKAIHTPVTPGQNQRYRDVLKGMTPKSRPAATDVLNEWSSLLPKLKELLANTSKMPLRMPDLSSNSVEFRRLKQLLNDLEVTTSSWTNAINQCRCVLQHAQQHSRR